MSSTFIHLQTLRERVISHPNTPVFKIPKLGTSWEDPEWIDISYAQFNADIERVARYWYAALGSHSIPLKSVVGVWLRGFCYADAVTIYAISRAGYVPQLFGFELPNTQIVLTLLASSSGKAVIHHPAKATLLAQSGTLLPCLPSVDYNHVSDGSQLSGLQLPPLPSADDEDYAFIYLSSGSVSGMPKVLPTTNKWLSTIQHKSTSAFAIGYEEYKAKDMGQDIYIWTSVLVVQKTSLSCSAYISSSESFSHSMQICLFQLILHHASCLVQPTHIDLSSSELVTMIRYTGINRTIQFSSLLRQHLQFARKNLPELVELMRNMRQVTYAGMPLGTELEGWASEIGIPLTNQYGCTECGQLMSSTLKSPYLELLPNVHAEFIPVRATPSDPTQVDPGYGSLLELHVLPISSDLPIPAFRSSTGGWLSGDLFEAVSPGKYIFRGRDDDWVKSFWSEKLDTKAIENEVYSVCGVDLVTNCVVVGDGRPWPMLFVELKPGVMSLGSESDTKINLTMTLQQVKEEIIKRLEHFNSLRYLHERVQDPRMVYIVLPPRKLPRTAVKGNIRRRGVEQEFVQEIEAIYASMPVNEIFGECVAVEDTVPKVDPDQTLAKASLSPLTNTATSPLNSTFTPAIVSPSPTSLSPSESMSTTPQSPVTPSETELDLITQYEEPSPSQSITANNVDTQPIIKERNVNSHIEGISEAVERNAMDLIIA